MKITTAIKCALFTIGLPVLLFLWILNIDNSIVLCLLKDIQNDLKDK